MFYYWSKLAKKFNLATPNQVKVLMVKGQGQGGEVRLYRSGGIKVSVEQTGVDQIDLVIYNDTLPQYCVVGRILDINEMELLW